MQDEKHEPEDAAWDDADVDEAELESFPASDPPAYTLGVEKQAQDGDRASMEPRRTA